MGEKYYLGLDMGTGSLGWAVTNAQYEVLRRHGKALWGVRLFDSAMTAEERRAFRTGRRRLDRRGWRIDILQELFAEEICKVDPGFFQRMKESKYYPEDKRNPDGSCPELPYALFVDENYTDKEYHKDFPTIYHLRKMLMETTETPDIRLVYLALHHMMKHRGHFLLSGDVGEIVKFRETFLQFLGNIREEDLEFDLEIGEDDLSFIEKTLKDRNCTRSAKKSILIKELHARTACEKAVLTLISGGTVKLSDIFGESRLDEEERPKISFADSGYEGYADVVQMELAEQFSIIESAKTVYDWAVLSDILGEHTLISDAKVESYEKHRSDLKLLKELVRAYLPRESFREIFAMEDKPDNYAAYIGMTKKNGKKQQLQTKRCSWEDFRKFLKKNVIEKLPDGDEKEYIEQEIEKETFLPRQVNRDNSVIPYQVHAYELKRILDNLDEKIPFIHENADKIMQLFKFRIPYYVGPLNNKTEGEQAKFSWAVRKENGKIYPWNFTDVIDVEQSAEQFICRMTNKCSYLVGEDVLPKDSLLYSKFMVLNELNNLRLNGEKIPVALKQRIYEELFCRTRKVTQKKLRSFLVREGIAERDVDISGIDGDFKSSLKAYHDFKEKMTGVELSQSEKEEIIRNIVLFGNDKKLLKQRLTKRFPQLTDKQKNLATSLSYQGWGRLSKKLLEEITAPAPGTNETWNLITALWESNDNFMQLLSNDYGFMKEVNAFNSRKEQPELCYQTIDDLYVSPAVKRQIWQTVQVIREIQKVMEQPPERVFVEMAREKQESKRTESRKKQLLDLYKACRKEESEWVSELCQNLENLEETQLRSDKLYLYYTQKGRCMYTGESIALEELWDNTKYDIDHIYPRSKTMDDSLKNRVLVKKEINETKDDNYPIAPQIQNKMASFWQMLLKGGFIPKEKYDRLMRKSELEPNELAGFIARQIVETRQSTKAVAEILKKAFPQTEVVYVKANTVSRFRQEYQMVKVREINDLHHAKDAYLNIVVGNTYFVKFTKDAARFVKENPGRSYNLEKMFQRDVCRGNDLAWKAGEEGTIRIVRRTMGKNNILVTRKAYEKKGGFFKDQPLKKGKGQFPIKNTDKRLCNLQKYGGYNQVATSYFVYVQSKNKKGKSQKTIEFVPIYLRDRIAQDEGYLNEYLRKNLQLIEPVVLLKEIKIDTLFKINGSYMWLSGRGKNKNSLEFKNANQLVLEYNDSETVKKVMKYINRKKENKTLKIMPTDHINKEALIHLFQIFIEKAKVPVYKVTLDGADKMLENAENKFERMSIEQECEMILKVLNLFRCVSTREDLKEIGEKNETGRISFSKRIDSGENINTISIITQSITGVYEKEIDLLKL